MLDNDDTKEVHRGKTLGTATLGQHSSSAELTVIVAFDCAHQTEELNYPAKVLLHLQHKHTGQDLTQEQGSCKKVVLFVAVYELYGLVSQRSMAVHSQTGCSWK